MRCGSRFLGRETANGETVKRARRPQRPRLLAEPQDPKRKRQRLIIISIVCPSQHRGRAESHQDRDSGSASAVTRPPRTDKQTHAHTYRILHNTDTRTHINTRLAQHAPTDIHSFSYSPQTSHIQTHHLTHIAYTTYNLSYKKVHCTTPHSQIPVFPFSPFRMCSTVGRTIIQWHDSRVSVARIRQVAKS